MARLGYDRVFGIGAPKTGTSSFGAAMEQLGFDHLGWNAYLWECWERRNLQPIMAAAHRHEAFEDLPWGAGDLYRQLAARFPRARFVLTVRDTASWSVSHERHYAPGSRIDERLWIRDYADRRDELVAEYERRNAAVQSFFEGRSGRLLVLDIAAGDGWDALCPFLGLRPLDQPFPLVNATPAEPPAITDC
jgi:hypothetical protein